MITINLPFPPKELSPNARIHHFAKARAVKKYRDECTWDAMLQWLRRTKGSGVRAVVTFHPPSHRHYDDDNLIGRFKTGQDALASVIGIDDSKWAVVYQRGDVEKGGRVNVVLVVTE